MTTTQDHVLPGLIAEETAVPQQQLPELEVRQQQRKERLLTTLLLLDSFGDEGLLGVGAAFDHAEFANLRKGALPPASLGIAKDDIGIRIRDVVEGAVQGHQSQTTVEGARSQQGGQRSSQTLKEQSHGSDAQALSCLAESGTGRRGLTGLQAAPGFEDLPDRHFREDSQGENDPTGDFEGEGAAAFVQAAGVAQDLLNFVGRDNLFQQEQAVENPSCLSGRQGAFANLWLGRPLPRWLLRLPRRRFLRPFLTHRSLPDACVSTKHKLSTGCGLSLQATLLYLGQRPGSW